MKYYFEVLKKYAVFSGRARRKEFWMFFLFNVIIGSVLSLVSNFLGGIYQLAILIPITAVGVRRMHDVNKSGWYLVIPIYSLILACTDGTKGDNKYGPDPK